MFLAADKHKPHTCRHPGSCTAHASHSCAARVVLTGGGVVAAGFADRAARCCVCRQLYSVQPRTHGWAWRTWAGVRYFVAAAAVTLLAFGLSGAAAASSAALQGMLSPLPGPATLAAALLRSSLPLQVRKGGCARAGPPWPHVAVLLLLLLGVRSHSLLAVLALALACVLAALHARGLRCAARCVTPMRPLRSPHVLGLLFRVLGWWPAKRLRRCGGPGRVMMRVDTGGRLGFAVISHGAPVPGLGPGAPA